MVPAAHLHSQTILPNVRFVSAVRLSSGRARHDDDQCWLQDLFLLPIPGCFPPLELLTEWVTRLLLARAKLNWVNRSVRP